MRTDSTTPRRARRGLPRLAAAALSLLAVAAVVAALLLINGKPFGTVLTTAQRDAGVLGHKLSNIPAPPASAPPPAHTFTLQQNALAATATPCPPTTLPPEALQPSPGRTGGVPPTATPTAAATPTATATAAATPTATATAVATPTRVALPVCGSGQPLAPHCYTTLPGPVPTLDDVRYALYNAAVQNAMPFSVLEAVGWQESGWQENVVACDGGVGVMQVMPDTQTWLNNQFGTDYSSYTLDDNIALGTTLLKWLYNYYLPFCDQGLPAGQTCDWATVWPGATDGATVRDIVVSAYNEGIGTMANYGIINWGYVTSVVSLWSQFLAAE